MHSAKIVALVMIVLGALALAYGGFTYTKSTHETQLGPIKLSVQDRERVNVPIWAGGGLVIAGVVLLVLGPKR